MISSGTILREYAHADRNTPLVYYNSLVRTTKRCSIRHQVHDNHAQRARSLPTPEEPPIPTTLRQCTDDPSQSRTSKRSFPLQKYKDSIQLHWKRSHLPPGGQRCQMLSHARADHPRQSAVGASQHDASRKRLRNIYYPAAQIR